MWQCRASYLEYHLGVYGIFLIFLSSDRFLKATHTHTLKIHTIATTTTTTTTTRDTYSEKETRLGRNPKKRECSGLEFRGIEGMKFGESGENARIFERLTCNCFEQIPVERGGSSERENCIIPSTNCVIVGCVRRTKKISIQSYV